MPRKLVAAIKELALPFNEHNLNKIVESIGNAQIVMIGEASHGTSEFYTVRAELTKLLINQKGFNIIAVEGDWPSAQTVNRYVKGYEDDNATATTILKESFNRWPQWMWANEEVKEFVEWLKDKMIHRVIKSGFMVLIYTVSL